MLLHPPTSPWSGIKERDYSKRALKTLFQSVAYCGAVRELWIFDVVRVQHEIPSIDERTLPSIRNTPIYEKRTLVLIAPFIATIVCPKIVGCIPTETKLSFPARKVGIDEHVARVNQGRTDANDKHQTFGLRNCLPCVSDTINIEE
jgi:hypothetical protein